MCGAKTASQVLNQIPQILLRPRWLGGFISEGNWKRPSHKWHLTLPRGVVSVSSSASLAVRMPGFDCCYYFKSFKCRGATTGISGSCTLACRKRKLADEEFSMMRLQVRCWWHLIKRWWWWCVGGTARFDWRMGDGGWGKSQRQQKKLHHTADDRPGWACHHTPNRGRCSQEDTQWSPPTALMLDICTPVCFEWAARKRGRVAWDFFSFYWISMFWEINKNASMCVRRTLFFSLSSCVNFQSRMIWSLVGDEGVNWWSQLYHSMCCWTPIVEI